MIIDTIPIQKWLSLPLAGEVREEVNTMKVDDIIRELGQEPNSENRFELKARLLNRLIEELGLDKGGDKLSVPFEDKPKETESGFVLAGNYTNNQIGKVLSSALPEILEDDTGCDKCIMRDLGLQKTDGEMIKI